MSRATEVLEALVRAEAAAREELERLLAPAGLRVGEVLREGDGWRVLLRNGARSRGREGDAAPTPGRAEGVLGLSAAETRPPPPTHDARALVRREGETLAALVDRAGERLRVCPGDGPGGIALPAPAPGERLAWLAGTLVGDTVLALRERGEPEDGESAHAQLPRQLALFREESVRVSGSADTGPFREALSRWSAAGFLLGEGVMDPEEEVWRA